MKIEHNHDFEDVELKFFMPGECFSHQGNLLLVQEGRSTNCVFATRLSDGKQFVFQGDVCVKPETNAKVVVD
jgi:hypothetical protein